MAVDEPFEERKSLEVGRIRGFEKDWLAGGVS